mmetsp:Transcript_12239/g.25260  ORF Transcript_12239/g.25260 Transcript_12239/m.25260 type:complete len:93 (-) Transcript_12239:103-381(-)
MEMMNTNILTLSIVRSGLSRRDQRDLSGFHVVQGIIYRLEYPHQALNRTAKDSMVDINILLGLEDRFGGHRLESRSSQPPLDVNGGKLELID